MYVYVYKTANGFSMHVLWKLWGGQTRRESAREQLDEGMSLTKGGSMGVREREKELSFELSRKSERHIHTWIAHGTNEEKKKQQHKNQSGCFRNILSFSVSQFILSGSLLREYIMFILYLCVRIFACPNEIKAFDFFFSVYFFVVFYFFMRRYAIW